MATLLTFLFFFFIFFLNGSALLARHFYSCNQVFLGIDDNGIVKRLSYAEIDEICYTQSDLSGSFADLPA